MPIRHWGAAAQSNTGGGAIASIELFDRALELDPNNIVALDWRSTNLGALGYFDAAREGLEHCLEVDPGYTKCRNELVQIYFVLDENDLALDALIRVLEEGYGQPSGAALDVFIASGRREEAMLLLGSFIGYGAPLGIFIDALIDPENHNPEDAWALAQAYRNANPGLVTDAAMYDYAAQLGIAPLPELTLEMMLNLNAWYPHHRELRNSEAFMELGQQFGIWDYWQEHGIPPQCQLNEDQERVYCN